MKTKHFIPAAILALAITFTLSCSGSDDNNGNDPNNEGGGFNENSPIFDREGRQSDIDGTIKTEFGYWEYENVGGVNVGDYINTLIDIGSVTNGVVNLQLPETIPDKYLTDVWYAWDWGSAKCTVSGNPDDPAKILDVVNFFLYHNDIEIDILLPRYKSDDIEEWISYVYANEAVNINCSDEYNHGIIVNLKFEKGWNKLYRRSSWNQSIGNFVAEYSTDPILTKKLKWTSNH
jgi:hypothetical protein